MTLAAVIPLFPPGVHDVVTETRDGATKISCSSGDWGPAVAFSEEGVRWARAAAFEHAVRHRGRCHAECVEEPECLYDGETS